MPEKKCIGQMLIEAGLINQEKLDKVLEEQKKSGQKIGSTLIRLGYVFEKDISKILNEQLGYPSINLSKIEIDKKILDLLNPEILRKHIVFPVYQIGSTLTLAMADPSNSFVQEEIRFSTNLRIQAVIAPESSILEAIDKYYGSSTGIEHQMFKIDEVESEENSNLEFMSIETDESSEFQTKKPSNITDESTKKNISDIKINTDASVFKIKSEDTNTDLFEKYKTDAFKKNGYEKAATEIGREERITTKSNGLTPEDMQQKWEASGGIRKTKKIHTEHFDSPESIVIHPSDIENLKKESGDEVDCSVFSPAEISRNETIMVLVFIHLPEQKEESMDMAREFDEETSRRGFKSLSIPVKRNSKLSFNLVLPKLVVDEPFQELIWKSRPESVQFSVSASEGCSIGNTVGTVTIFNGSVPVGNIKFKIKICEEKQTETIDQANPIGEQANRFTKAFISYASKDRDKVLARIQMIKVLGIDYFQDILDLDPGARWERELYKHIDECDLFLLFWSTASKESEWVMKEVHYALNRKGGDDLAPPEIYPVIIEGPPIPLPPQELSHLHFNDRILYVMGRD